MVALGPAAGAAASWAARYVPGSLRRLRSGGGGSASQAPPAPPPELYAVSVQLAAGEQVVLEALADSSLEQLQRECQQAAGVPVSLQRLVVQEEPLQSGLRSLAHSVSNRRQLSRQLADWSSFLLVPEGLRRELRGQGLAGWLRQHVWERIREPRQAPPGTVWVLVATLDGGRHHILLHSATTLRQLRCEVVLQAGVPTRVQHVVVAEQQEPGWAVRMLRALTPWLAAAWAWLAAAVRWVLGLPPSSELVVRLQMESGREVELSGVSPDTSLRELQRQVWEQHGERLSLQGLSLSPAGKAAAGGGAGGSSRGASGDGGGGLSCGRLSPGWGADGEGGCGSVGGAGSSSVCSSPTKRSLRM